MITKTDKSSSKKIIFFTPDFIARPIGASEKDSLGSLKNFIDLGYEITLVIFAYSWVFKYVNEINDLEKKVDELKIIEYKKSKLKNRLTNVFRLDGYTDQYFNEETVFELNEMYGNKHFDLVWLDFTYMWPLKKIFSDSKIIIRSKNFEPLHFISENKKNILNFIKFIPKLLSEIKSVRISDTFLAITPKEKKLYRLFKSNVKLYPLSYLKNNHYQYINREVENVFFSGGSYNVKHNLDALIYILEEILPFLKKKNITLNITGSKVPRSLLEIDDEFLKFWGYIDEKDFLNFYRSMDVNIAPIISGYGMQSKIFEPMSIGIPTLTFKKGLRGYAFSGGSEYLDLKENLNDILFAHKVQKVSINSFKKSKKFFDYNFFEICEITSN